MTVDYNFTLTFKSEADKVNAEHLVLNVFFA
jgi:hypothetical protein